MPNSEEINKNLKMAYHPKKEYNAYNIAREGILVEIPGRKGVPVCILADNKENALSAFIEKSPANPNDLKDLEARVISNARNITLPAELHPDYSQEKYKIPKKAYKIPIEEVFDENASTPPHILNLNVRAVNLMRAMNIKTVGSFLAIPKKEIYLKTNLGETIRNYIKLKLQKKGFKTSW